MKRTIVDGDTPYLPEEVIRNVLKRLPVKSLIRFHCVCKSWKNLIKNPSFIADHLHHSTYHGSSLLFEQVGLGPSHLFSLGCDMRLHELQKPPCIDSWSHVRIVGSSNGLLLYVGRSGFPVIISFCLWSPAIRHVSVKDHDFDGNFFVGFGFSPIVNDYKILIANIPRYEVNRVEVFSLSTQRWKKIKFGDLKGVNLYSKTVTANGAMFWRGSKSVVRKKCEYTIELVVVFDIAMETFTLIPMPPLDSNSKDKLIVLENKLGVIVHTIKARYSWIDLWVMEEGIGAPEERWSWTKKYSTRRNFLGISWMDPLCIWGDEMVCNTNDMSGHGETECEENTELITSLSLLNLRTNELKKIATSKCGNEFSVIFNHEESLVPVDTIHIEEA